jgi:anhydro-N-acetylmuramic acid kinase
MPMSFSPKSHPKVQGEDFNLEWLDQQLSDWRNDILYNELEDTLKIFRQL